MRCYFCGKEEKVIPEKRKLWNGKMAEQCVHCFKCIETGLIVAKEKGVIDFANSIGGGDRMKVEKDAIGGDFLRAAYVKEHKIPELLIISDAEIAKFKDKQGVETEKLQFKIQYEGYQENKGMPDIWTLNGKSKNALIDAWGDDTDAWKGKPIPIGISGEGEYLHIKVDEIRIK